MGWQSDWLYRLIPVEIDLILEQLSRDPFYASPINKFIVYEYNYLYGCQAQEEIKVLKYGMYRERFLEHLSHYEKISKVYSRCKNLGDFFSIGIINFAINKKRKSLKIFITLGEWRHCFFGFDISGQGKRGKLINKKRLYFSRISMPFKNFIELGKRDPKSGEQISL